MLRAIAGFELKYQVRSLLFAVLFVILFALTFALITDDPADGLGASTNVKWNSPYVVMICLLLMSLFGTLTTAAFVVHSIHRDFELRTDALFFSCPVARWQYLGGRFLGSFLAGLLIFAGVCLATLLGSFAPWIPKEHLGPIEIWPAIPSTVTGSARRVRSRGRWSTSSAEPSPFSRCSSPRSTPATSSGASGRSSSTK